jgi:hypothetical protein
MGRTATSSQRGGTLASTWNRDQVSTLSFTSPIETQFRAVSADIVISGQAFEHMEFFGWRGLKCVELSDRVA